MINTCVFGVRFGSLEITSTGACICTRLVFRIVSVYAGYNVQSFAEINIILVPTRERDAPSSNLCIPGDTGDWRSKVTLDLVYTAVHNSNLRVNSVCAAVHSVTKTTRRMLSHVIC
jgi:hypothetical protein